MKDSEFQNPGWSFGIVRRHVNPRPFLLLAVVAAALRLGSPSPNTAAEISPVNPVPIGSLVRVRFNEGETSGGVSRMPDATDATFEVDAEETEYGFIFTGRRGRYVVSVHREGSKLQRQYLVEISDSVPPGPVPPPGPGPGPSPGPVTVPDRHGIGKRSYDEAMKIGDFAGAAVMAAIFDEAATHLASDVGGDLVDQLNRTADRIRVEIDARVANSVAWAKWRTMWKLRQHEIWNAGMRDKLSWQEVFKETSDALKLVKPSTRTRRTATRAFRIDDLTAVDRYIYSR